MEWYAEIAVRFARRMPVQTEGYTERQEDDTAPNSRASAPAFARDWGSKEDTAYDEFAG